MSSWGFPSIMLRPARDIICCQYRRLHCTLLHGCNRQSDQQKNKSVSCSKNESSCSHNAATIRCMGGWQRKFRETPGRADAQQWARNQVNRQDFAQQGSVSEILNVESRECQSIRSWRFRMSRSTAQAMYNLWISSWCMHHEGHHLNCISLSTACTMDMPLTVSTSTHQGTLHNFEFDSNGVICDKWTVIRIHSRLWLSRQAITAKFDSWQHIFICCTESTHSHGIANDYLHISIYFPITMTWLCSKVSSCIVGLVPNMGLCRCAYGNSATFWVSTKAIRSWLRRESV